MQLPSRLYEGVQREVDTDPALVSEAARLSELVERELCTLIPGVESLGAEVDRISAVGYGGANGVEGTGGCEKLRDHDER
jgi:hypothetical protein